MLFVKLKCQSHKKPKILLHWDSYKNLLLSIYFQISYRYLGTDFGPIIYISFYWSGLVYFLFVAYSNYVIMM